MRKRIVSLLSIGLLAVAASGCYNTTTNAKKVPTWVMMNTMSQGQVIAPYQKKYTQWYVLWGLVPLNSPAVGDDIGAAIKANNAKYMDSVQINTGMKFPMVLLNMITGIITVYNQQIVVSGDLKR